MDVFFSFKKFLEGSTTINSKDGTKNSESVKIEDNRSLVEKIQKYLLSNRVAMLQCEACRLRFYRLVEIQRQSVKNWTIVNADELIKSITEIKQSNQQSSAIWNRVIFEFQGCIPIIIPFFFLAINNRKHFFNSMRLT